MTANYGKWGISRREFLENHRQSEYNQLKAENKLIPHLNEVDKQAWKLWERIMEQLEQQPPSPQPPQGTMEWVGWQNRLRAIADEQVLSDIIYE